MIYQLILFSIILVCVSSFYIWCFHTKSGQKWFKSLD